jgi:elongation factor Ts
LNISSCLPFFLDKQVSTPPYSSVHLHPATDKAMQELRKKGMAAAGKKASRRAAEGLVAVLNTNTGAALVEINSETDFVARNDQFMALAGSVAAAALTLPASAQRPGFELDVEALKATALEDGATVADAVTRVAAVVRENLSLRRAFGILPGPGAGSVVVGSYLHAGVGPGLGRIAALLKMETVSGEELQGNARAAAEVGLGLYWGYLGGLRVAVVHLRLQKLKIIKTIVHAWCAGSSP